MYFFLNIRCSEFVADCKSFLFAPHSSLYGVNHLIRIYPNHLPSLCMLRSFYPQTYIIGNEYWPSPPSDSKRIVNYFRALWFLRLRSRIPSSPFHRTPFIHGRRRASAHDDEISSFYESSFSHRPARRPVSN